FFESTAFTSWSTSTSAVSRRLAESLRWVASAAPSRARTLRLSELSASAWLTVRALPTTARTWSGSTALTSRSASCDRPWICATTGGTVLLISARFFSVTSTLGALAAKALAKVSALSSVEWTCSELSARSLSARSATELPFADRFWTLSTIARTLSGSTAWTTRSAFWDRLWICATTGGTVLLISAKFFSVTSTLGALAAKALAKVSALSSVEWTCSELSARSLSARSATELPFADRFWTLSTIARTLSGSTAWRTRFAFADRSWICATTGGTVLLISA